MTCTCASAPGEKLYGARRHSVVFLDVNNSPKSDIFTGLDPSPCVIRDALRRKQHMVTSGNIVNNMVKDVQSDVWLCVCRRRFRFPTVVCPITSETFRQCWMFSALLLD